MIEILASYEPQLQYLAEWWKQLFGESEGKQGRGIFPASVTFTADLHSMGQYIQEGERTLFETVVSVAAPEHRVKIGSDPDNLDGLNFLTGKRLSEINHTAELGVSLAHADGGVPNLRIEIPRIDARSLGTLIYFFEKACGISGYLLGVNPFDLQNPYAFGAAYHHRVDDLIRNDAVNECQLVSAVVRSRHYHRFADTAHLPGFLIELAEKPVHTGYGIVVCPILAVGIFTGKFLGSFVESIGTRHLHEPVRADVLIHFEILLLVENDINLLREIRIVAAYLPFGHMPAVNIDRLGIRRGRRSSFLVVTATDQRHSEKRHCQ